MITAALASAFACVFALSACAAAQAKQHKAHHAQAPAMPEDAADAMPYGQREDVMRFGADAAERHGLDTAWVQEALKRSRRLPSVAKLIMPPPTGVAKNWMAYRERFVEPRRIAAGVAFWNANKGWLQLAQERYGVPPEIIVGIVGVESLYGQQTGRFRVIDALATLSFDFPAGRKDRSEFFRDELANFLVVCEHEHVSPLEWRGSYAGAIGMPQFMPSSILQHAVDFDGDEHIDLQNNPADVIGSVAGFLHDAGWQPSVPTYFEVAVPVDTAERAKLLEPDILPSFTATDMAAHGAGLGDAAKAYDGKLALVELQNGDAAPSYVAGTNNFYAITRYNWSSYYAMAVIALGEAVRQQRGP